MPATMNGRPRERKQREYKSKTTQWRQWKGVNLVDHRTAIDDDELAWLENVIPVGKGALQVVNGAGSTVATIAAGIASVWGVTMNGTPLMITVNSDGSMSQVTTGGVVTAICAAGVMSTAAHVTMWRGSPVLIGDPTKGYATWDGAAFTLVDATKLSTSLAVFEGRVWMALNRVITFTAPNTNNDFTAANGAGTSTITDEAFEGNIIALVSAIEQLWVIGQSAIDAISNVTAVAGPPVVTTFSTTNIVTDLGSNAPASVRGYLRALTLMAPFGVYALSGVTPQKLSDNLDELFASLTLTPDVPAAVGVVRSLLCLFFMVTYTGTNSQAQAAASSSASIPLLLGFVKGKWFLAVQRTTLKWITTLRVNGVSQVWAADTSGNLYQCFGASDSTAVIGKVSSKLYDFGRGDAWKQEYKMGVEVQGSLALTNLAMTVDTEYSATAVTLTTTNAYTLLNSSSGVLQLLNSLSQNINLVGQGQVIAATTAPTGGHYLGWSITFNDAPFKLITARKEYVMTKEWA